MYCIVQWNDYINLPVALEVGIPPRVDGLLASGFLFLLLINSAMLASKGSALSEDAAAFVSVPSLESPVAAASFFLSSLFSGTGLKNDPDTLFDMFNFETAILPVFLVADPIENAFDTDNPKKRNDATAKIVKRLLLLLLDVLVVFISIFDNSK